jgi:hypothetical protein
MDSDELTLRWQRLQAVAELHTDLGLTAVHLGSICISMWVITVKPIRVIGMHSDRRQRIGDLNLRDFCLYRAICLELEALDETIQLQGLLGNDFLELSTAMRDRRLLVEWLLDLHLPPSSDYSDSGLTPEMEQQLLIHALD